MPRSWGRFEGPRPVDALIDILGSEDTGARQAAGVILEEIAFERFKEVALGVRACPRQAAAANLALSELPTCSWRSPSRA